MRHRGGGAEVVDGAWWMVVFLKFWRVARYTGWWTEGWLGGGDEHLGGGWCLVGGDAFGGWLHVGTLNGGWWLAVA